MAVIFHIVADSMLVAADGVPGFFPGAAFENQLDCQATLVQPAVVCRSHCFFQFTDLAFCFPVPHSSSVFFSIRLQEEKRMQFNSIYIVTELVFQQVVASIGVMVEGQRYLSLFLSQSLALQLVWEYL